MRVIVLGGTRFIGRAAVERLAHAGHEVMVVHRGQAEPANWVAVRHVHAERQKLADAWGELAEFNGEVIAPPGMAETAQRAGHVPGAQSIPWAQAANEDGTFKSADELRQPPNP